MVTLGRRDLKAFKDRLVLKEKKVSRVSRVKLALRVIKEILANADRQVKPHMNMR